MIGCYLTNLVHPDTSDDHNYILGEDFQIDYVLVSNITLPEDKLLQNNNANRYEDYILNYNDIEFIWL